MEICLSPSSADAPGPSLNRRNYGTRIAGEQREQRMKREVQNHLSLGVFHLAAERTCSFFRFIEGDVFQHGCLRSPFLIHTVRNQMQSRRSVAVRWRVWLHRRQIYKRNQTKREDVNEMWTINKVNDVDGNILNFIQSKRRRHRLLFGAPVLSCFDSGSAHRKELIDSQRTALGRRSEEGPNGA